MRGISSAGGGKSSIWGQWGEFSGANHTFGLARSPRYVQIGGLERISCLRSLA